MGKPDKAEEALRDSHHEDAAPPPYAPADSAPGYVDEAPEYSVPRLNHIAVGKGESSAQGGSAGTLIFPSKFTCYYKFGSASTWLGTSKDNLLHCVSPPRLFGQPNTILRTTADKESTPLAMAHKPTGSGWRTSPITVPPRPGGDWKEQVSTEMTIKSDMSSRFSVNVGTDRRLEYFEWRSSNGNEVRELSGSRIGRGFKLVRLMGPETGEGGKRHDREGGFTSDGKEIVAVFGYGNSMSSGPDFAFMGTGLTGAFGETWEIMAVMTFLRVHEYNSTGA